eukprot:SAG11_NODE_13619_length_647_cov_0.793796_1_plen_108_part_10
MQEKDSNEAAAKVVQDMVKGFGARLKAASASKTGGSDKAGSSNRGGGDSQSAANKQSDETSYRTQQQQMRQRWGQQQHKTPRSTEASSATERTATAVPIPREELDASR